MADPTLDDALKLVDKLDMAVMRMLEATRVHDPKQGGSPLEGPATQIASTATQIETLLVNVQPATLPKQEQLEQDIERLNKELHKKEELMQYTQKKLDRWMKFVSDLQNKHSNMLYEDFPAADAPL